MYISMKEIIKLSILFVLLWGLMLFGLGILWNATADCNARGGAMVKGVFLPVCVAGVK